MPSIICTRLTTNLPRSSMVSASTRSITPGMARTSVATSAALPTSVWIRMYALTATSRDRSGRWSTGTDDHGPDREAHEEQAAEPVEQIALLHELGPVAVDDGDADDRDEAIEHVELHRFELLA